MKKRNQKQNVRTAAKRGAISKRDRRDAMRRALDAAIRETGVGTDALRIKNTDLPAGRPRKGTPRAEEKAAVGTYQSTRSGFGFVHVEGLPRDLFIPASEGGGAVSGDVVEVRYRTYPGRDGERTEGRVTKIREGVTELVGTLVREDPRGLRRVSPGYAVEPDDRHLGIRPRVLSVGSARAGDKVRIRLDRSPLGMTGEVLTVYGSAETKDANYLAILDECGIEVDYPAPAVAQANEAANTPIDRENRRDLTGETIFTIDGADAKDLDDAVSLTAKRDGTYELGVHIADVSYYVAEKTPLDRAVMARGTSVYFVDKVVPMLPPVLSNGACSLNAGVDRAALSATITLSAEGEILGTKLDATVIRSRVRGVYSEVNDIFENGTKSAFREKYAPVLPTLRKMRKLADLLKSRAKARGALTLDTAEAKILLDEAGHPESVVRRERGEAEEMIEAFMLTANEGVATLLHSLSLPCVYRVHAAPPEDKRRALALYLHNLGFSTAALHSDKLSPLAVSAIIDRARERGIGDPVSYMALRSMSKAVYDDKPAPHFGLAIPTYCHFTSPIRRLSDLATHRVIRRVLLGDAPAARYASYVHRAAAAATEAELRAQSAERKIENLYKALYLSDHIGEVRDAVVTSVTAFGVFAMLDDTCEGLIPLSELPGTFFYDEETLTLRSRDTIYRLGDRIRVRIEEVSVSEGKARFSDIRYTEEN